MPETLSTPSHASFEEGVLNNSQQLPEMEEHRMMNKDIYSAMRAFSKEHLPEERQEALEAIRAMRRARDSASDRQAHINEELSTTEVQIEDAHQQESISERQAELIKIELSQRETSIITRALDFVRPGMRRGLEEKYETGQQEYASHQQEAAVLQARYDELTKEYQRLQMDKYDATRGQWKQLQAHYREEVSPLYWEEKKKEALFELEAYKQEHGQIAEIAAEDGLYFTHSTQFFNNGSWGSNPYLREDKEFGWINKAALVLYEKPSIAASSLSVENEYKSTWGNVGLLLKGGMVEFASPYDAGTYPQADGSRLYHRTIETVDHYREGIDKATAVSRASGREYEYEGQKYMQQTPFNEYVISEPQAAGLFINLGSAQGRREAGEDINPARPLESGLLIRRQQKKDRSYEEIYLKDIFKGADQLNLPVFGFYPGQRTAFELSLDPKTEQVTAIRAVSPREMTQVPSNHELPPNIAELADILDKDTIEADKKLAAVL